jgi:hypothetical protein
LVSSGVRTTNVWYPETAFRLAVRLRLYVSDDPSRLGIARDFVVNMETPVEVIYGLIDAMDELQERQEAIPIRGRRALDVLLRRAAEQIQQGDIVRMAQSLERFQKRIAAQTDSLGTVNAEDLIRIAQAVIDALPGRN